jgi:hypothetical protein
LNAVRHQTGYTLPMTHRLLLGSLLLTDMLTGCGGPSVATQPRRAATTPAVAVQGPPPPAPPAPVIVVPIPDPGPPFSEADLINAGSHYLGAVAAKKDTRKPTRGSDRTSSVDLGDGWTATATPTEQSCENGDATTTWRLTFASKRGRWAIHRFATYETDCAGKEVGVGGLELKAADIIPGGAQELIIEAPVQEMLYAQPAGAKDACGTEGWTGNRIWICGFEGVTPVCWATFETGRDTRKMTTCGNEHDDPMYDTNKWGRDWSFEAGDAPTLIVDGKRFPLRTLACSNKAMRAVLGCKNLPVAPSVK